MTITRRIVFLLFVLALSLTLTVGLAGVVRIANLKGLQPTLTIADANGFNPGTTMLAHASNEPRSASVKTCLAEQITCE